MLIQQPLWNAYQIEADGLGAGDPMLNKRRPVPAWRVTWRKTDIKQLSSTLFCYNCDYF